MRLAVCMDRVCVRGSKVRCCKIQRCLVASMQMAEQLNSPHYMMGCKTGESLSVGPVFCFSILGSCRYMADYARGPSPSVAIKGSF